MTGLWKIFRIFARVIDTNHEMNENFAIQLFEGNKVRIVWDAEQEKYYFAVADIVQVLTDTVNPRDYIKKMLRRDPELKSKWGTICPPVEMLAPDYIKPIDSKAHDALPLEKDDE